MTPEQAAQMQAQMAQVQQMMQGGGTALPAPPATAGPDSGQPQMSDVMLWYQPTE